MAIFYVANCKRLPKGSRVATLRCKSSSKSPGCLEEVLLEVAQDIWGQKPWVM